MREGLDRLWFSCSDRYRRRGIMSGLTIDASPNKAGYWMLGGRVGTAVVDEEVVPAFVSLLAAAVVVVEDGMLIDEA